MKLEHHNLTQDYYRNDHWIVGVILGWVILYYVIKTAVKNGILEARNSSASQASHRTASPELPTNPEQVRLQQRYDRGEITFDEYQAEWKRLR